MLFSKMHGLCNDFMILDFIKQKKIILNSKIIKKLSNRNTGIGFDQLLIVEKTNNKKYDFHYRIFNADGKEVNQCGNGARCLAIFLHLKKLTKKKKIRISTNNGSIYLNIKKNNFVCVNMGIPKFKPQDIPFNNEKKHNNKNELYKITLNNKQHVKFSIVSLGNPHCVIQVNNIHDYPVKHIGSLISTNNLFPEGVNVNFVEIINKNNINLRVYERGVGETKACGSGACATVSTFIKKGILSNHVIVNLLGGKLNIFWKGTTKYPIFMTGKATHVYDGKINISNII